MKYKVLHSFTDLQDNAFHYETGMSYPRNGYKPSKGRIEELSGNNNRHGLPLIIAVEVTTDDTKQFTRGNYRRFNS